MMLIVVDSGVRSGSHAGLSGPTDRPKPSRIVVVRYRGRPPTDDEISTALALDLSARSLYVVSTAALESRRQRLAAHEQLDDSDRSRPSRSQMVFHKLVRHLLRRPLLTHAEER